MGDRSATETNNKQKSSKMEGFSIVYIKQYCHP